MSDTPARGAPSPVGVPAPVDPFLRDVLPVVLAGGRGQRLHELTVATCKAAIPLGPGRRLVDGAMESAAAAGRALVITGYRSGVVAQHLREVWAPHLGAGCLALHDAWRSNARGAVEALRELVPRIDAHTPRDLLLLPADHVGRIDLRALLAAHRGRSATLTVAARPVPRAGPVTPGTLSVEPNGVVAHVAQSVQSAARRPACPGDPFRALRTTGLCVISWAWLRDTLLRSPWIAEVDSHLLPAAINGGRCFAHVHAADDFHDIDTLDDLLTAALAYRGPLLSHPTVGERSYARNVTESLVMEGAIVSLGSRLSRVVVAPGAVVPFNTHVGFEPDEDARWFRRTEGGTTLLTADMLLAQAAARAAVLH